MTVEKREIAINKIITPYGMNVFSALLPNSQLPFFLELKEKGIEYEKILRQKLFSIVDEKIDEKIPIVILDSGIVIGTSIVKESIIQSKERMICYILNESIIGVGDIENALKIFNEDELDYLSWWFLNAFSVEYKLEVKGCRKLHKSSRTITVFINKVNKSIPVSEKTKRIFFKEYGVSEERNNLKSSDAWTFKIDIYNVNKYNMTNDIKTSKQYQYIVNMIFNKNSVHMLYYGDPFRYRRYQNKLKTYRRRINKKKFHMDDFIIDSSGILGLYGVRMPTDINYLSVARNAKNIEYKYIRCHMHVIDTYEKSVLEIVTLPENYLYFNDIKFMAPNIVLKACMNRKELSKKIDSIFLAYITKRWTLDREHKRFIIILKIVHYINRNKREVKKMIKYVLYILEGKHEEGYHIWFG